MSQPNNLSYPPGLGTIAFRPSAFTPSQSERAQTWQTSDSRRKYLETRASNIGHQIGLKHEKLARHYHDSFHYTQRALAEYVEIGLELGRELPHPSPYTLSMGWPCMTLIECRITPNSEQQLDQSRTAGPPVSGLGFDLPPSTPLPVTQKRSSPASNSASHGVPSPLKADAPSFVQDAQGSSLLSPISALPASVPHADANPNPASSANPVAPMHIVPPTPYEHFGVVNSPMHLPQPNVQGNSPFHLPQPNSPGNPPTHLPKPNVPGGNPPAHLPQANVPGGNPPAHLPKPNVPGGNQPAHLPQPSVQGGNLPAYLPQPSVQGGNLPAHLPKPSVPENSPGNPPWTRHTPRAKNSSRAEDSSQAENPSRAKNSPQAKNPPQYKILSRAKNPSQANNPSSVENSPQASNSSPTDNSSRAKNLSWAEHLSRVGNPLRTEDKSPAGNPLRTEDKSPAGNPSSAGNPRWVRSLLSESESDDGSSTVRCASEEEKSDLRADVETANTSPNPEPQQFWLDRGVRGVRRFRTVREYQEYQADRGCQKKQEDQEDQDRDQDQGSRQVSELLNRLRKQPPKVGF